METMANAGVVFGLIGVSASMVGIVALVKVASLRKEFEKLQAEVEALQR